MYNPPNWRHLQGVPTSGAIVTTRFSDTSNCAVVEVTMAEGFSELWCAKTELAEATQAISDLYGHLGAGAIDVLEQLNEASTEGAQLDTYRLLPHILTVSDMFTAPAGTRP
jgi:hypothetical protein